MPPVVPVIATIATSAVAVAVESLTAKIIITVAISVASATITRAAAPNYTAEARDRQHIIRSAVANHRIVYGQAKVSGALVFAASTGAKNEYAHLVIPLAGHEVEEIGDVYFNDQLATDYDPAYYRISKHLGADNQPADPDLVAEVAEWTDAHRLQGIAYIYVRLQYDQDIWPLGLPNISAVVKGKKLYDPRTGATAWSENWALCVRDYLVSDYGLFADPAEEIDEASFIAAANICDEQAATPAGTQPRYTSNGTVDLGNRPADILEGLLTAGAGSLAYSQGKYRLYAGAYVEPALDLDESDLRGPLKVRPRASRRELFNGVRGIYVNPVNDWQPADFPPVKNPTYQGEDGGQEILRDIELPFTTDPTEAQRIAKIHLEKARQGITVEFPATYKALQLTAFDNVRLSIAQLGWTQKVFKVVDWSLAEAGGVDLVLQEEAAASYAWNGGEATTVDPAPDTSLASAASCAPPVGLTLASGSAHLLVTGDGTVVTRIFAQWSAPADAFVVRYEVEYKRAVETDWTQLPAVSPQCYIGPLKDGERYDVRVRAVNSLGVRSAWLTSVNHTVVGKSEPPPSVDIFLVSRQPDGTREFSWKLAGAPPDLAGYKIRYRLGTGWTWNDLYDLNDGLLLASPHETNQLAAGSYTFAIVTVDTSGLQSSPVFITSDLADPRLGGVILTEYPASAGWPGTKSGSYVDSNGFLVATDTKTWADFAADGIDWAGWTTWARAATSPIVYEHTVIDLGATLEFTPLVTAIGDGAATIEIDFSTDNLAWNGWTTPQLVTARYLKVKLSLTGSYPILRALNILLSAQPITEEVNDLATSTLAGAYRIGVGDVRLPIRESYSVITQVMVALQGVGAGWSWEIIDKDTVTGPRIKIYNASGVLADATIDAFVRGL